jgi:hypothetical protein
MQWTLRPVKDGFHIVYNGFYNSRRTHLHMMQIV